MLPLNAGASIGPGEPNARVRVALHVGRVLLEEQLEQGEVHRASAEGRLVDAFAQGRPDAAGHGFDEAGRAQREVAAPTEVDLRVRVEQAVVVVNQVRSVDRSDVPQVRVGQSALRDDGGLLVEVAAELEVEVDAPGEIGASSG